MFGSVFSIVKSFFDSQFLVNYFLPSLIFWTLLVIVWIAGSEQEAMALEWWAKNSVRQGVEITGFLSWVVMFAYIVAGQVESILRFYEGYWDFPGSKSHPPHRHGQSWHQRKLADADAALDGDWQRYQEIYFGYPLPTQPEEVMPTRLGNILKNSELYPKDRYNIDAVLIWPCLYNLLPATFSQTIVNLRGSLDFMLLISILGAIFAFVSGAYLLIMKASPLVFMYCFGGGLLVAYLCYRAALGRALLYAQQIKAAFDLYRNEVLKHNFCNEVSFEHLERSSTYDVPVAYVKLSGKSFKEYVLEHSVGGKRGDGRFLQVSEVLPLQFRP